MRALDGAVMNKDHLVEIQREMYLNTGIHIPIENVGRAVLQFPKRYGIMKWRKTLNKLKLFNKQLAQEEIAARIRRQL